MHSKGNHWQNEKTIYWMGENICKWYDWEGINTQHVERVNTTQHPKKKQPNFKNGHQNWIDIFPKKKCRCPTWKDAQHC